MSRSILIATSSSLSAGGIGSFCALLSESLADQGYEPIVVSPATAPGKSWRQYGARVAYEIGSEVTPEDGLRQIEEIIVRHQCLGILNNDHPYVQAYAPISEVPLVSICHFETGIIGKLATENAPAVDYIVAISEDMRDTITAFSTVLKDQVRTVHTGISANLSNDYASKNRTKTLFLGGGDRRKGADLVEQLAVRLAQSTHCAPIEWYGDLGRQQLKRLSKLRSVRLMGHQPRDKVLSSLQEARFLLFPSRAEGCPMALLEAMGQGVVPISTVGRGAMREIVRHNLNGFIFTSRDWVSSAYDLLQKDFSDESWRIMSGAAQADVQEKFNIDQKATELVNLLKFPRIVRPTSPHTRAIYWHRSRRRDFPIGIIDSLRFRFGIVKRGALVSLPRPQWVNRSASEELSEN